MAEHATDPLPLQAIGAAIAGIAAVYGFTQTGHFSQAYRERFGELPSETAGRRGVR